MLQEMSAFGAIYMYGS